MKYSFKIGSAWSIPIELHITFVLLIVSVFFLSFPDLYSFFLILFLFVFVVVHELSHSMVAKRYNIKVRKIVLYPIGGVSEIEEIPDRPSVEWRMAIAGPLTSFGLGIVLLVLSQVIFREAPSLITARSLAYDLAITNLGLGAFNLVPAFPMDGGRVFRALLAERMSFSDATKYASFIGRLLGIGMVIFGILYNFWLSIVGVFVYIGAVEEADQTIVSTTIARVRVSDVMFSDVASVNPETPLTKALEVMFRARYHDALVEDGGSFQGVVTWNEIMKVKPEERNTLRVNQLPMKQVSVFPDESILEAHKAMTREGLDLVPVVDREKPSKIVGAITSESVVYAYEKSKSLR